MAVGSYSITVANIPAKDEVTGLKVVQQAVENIGVMFEISTVRRVNWDFVNGKSGELAH